MAVKLKLVLKQIHWSLVLRAAGFGASWFLLPLWAFLIIAFYFYFVPFFKPAEIFTPFFLTLLFAAMEPVSIWLAIFFVVIFYLILGIKDLIFIDRRSSYEILALLILFLTFLRFFSYFDSWDGAAAFFGAFLVSFVFFLLAKRFSFYGRLPVATQEKTDSTNQLFPESFVSNKSIKIAAGVMAFCIYALIIALLFLPINFLYQSALLFVVAATFLEFLIDYAGKILTRTKILYALSIFFVFLVIILESAQWSL